MKSIGICYSEQAIKVSNSHSPTDHHHQVFSSSTTNNYRVKLSTGKKFLIKLTWRESLSKQGFSIAISEYFPVSLPECISTGDSIFSLQRARGIECLELSGGSKVEVCWDFRRAGYDLGPEPVKGFYVVIIVDSEPGLILGDMEMEERELQVRKRIVISDHIKYSSEFKLISRCELFTAGNASACYSTRAKFCDNGKCHDILIKFSGEDHDTVSSENSILSVYVDRKSVIEVKRLRWNFRGNETIFLDGGLVVVDLMWDLHDWLLSGNNGVFLFRRRSGMDNSRLWLEEKMNTIDQENVGFSLLISACKKNPD